jgi:putative transposase
MSTYTQILYQIVFATKYRKKILIKNEREELFKYIRGVLNNKKCHTYWINGVEDHIHILTHIHPSVSLSSLVKDIKVSSSIFIKEQKLFADFIGWQNGYGAFTYNIKDKNRLTEYLKNQEIHHRNKSFLEEYVELLEEHGIAYDEKYLI